MMIQMMVMMTLMIYDNNNINDSHNDDDDHDNYDHDNYEIAVMMQDR